HGFPGAWVFITLAPTSTIVPIATEVGAERRMYLALAGILVVVVVLIARLAAVIAPGERDRGARRVAALLVLVGAAARAAATVARNREYQSALILAGKTLERWPSGLAHYMVGTELAAVGRHQEAQPYLREAARTVPRAHYTLASELFDQGRRNEAISELQ